MFTYYLAIALLLDSGTAPQLLKGFQSNEECQVEAMKSNHADKRLKEPAFQAKGAAYVCFKFIAPV